MAACLGLVARRRSGSRTSVAELPVVDRRLGAVVIRPHIVRLEGDAVNFLFGVARLAVPCVRQCYFSDVLLGLEVEPEHPHEVVEHGVQVVCQPDRERRGDALQLEIVEVPEVCVVLRVAATQLVDVKSVDLVADLPHHRVVTALVFESADDFLLVVVGAVR